MSEFLKRSFLEHAEIAQDFHIFVKNRSVFWVGNPAKVVWYSNVILDILPKSDISWVPVSMGQARKRGQNWWVLMGFWVKKHRFGGSKRGHFPAKSASISTKLDPIGTFRDPKPGP